MDQTGLQLSIVLASVFYMLWLKTCDVMPILELQAPSTIPVLGL